MNDIAYEFMQDVREKKKNSYGAHHKPRKSGCKLPFEYRSKKEIMNMNSEVKDYSKPIPFEEFKKLSHEEQVKQLDIWNDVYGASFGNLALLLDSTPGKMKNFFNKKGFVPYGNCRVGCNKEMRDKKKKLEKVCLDYYGHGNDKKKTEKKIENNEPLGPEDVSLDLVKPLVSGSRFNFSIDGEFTGSEVEKFLQGIVFVAGIQYPVKKKYKLVLNFEEIVE